MHPHPLQPSLTQHKNKYIKMTENTLNIYAQQTGTKIWNKFGSASCSSVLIHYTVYNYTKYSLYHSAHLNRQWCTIRFSTNQRTVTPLKKTRKKK